MTSKAMRKFSLKMVFIGLVLMIGVTFGLPSCVFAFTSYPDNIGVTLQLGTADYSIQPDNNGTPEDTTDDTKYVNLPTATVIDYDAVLNITAVAVNASAYSQNITPTETSADSGVWTSKLYLQDNIKNYKVTYTLNNGNNVLTTATVDVVIESDTPSFEWVDNSEQIIPTQANRSTTDESVTIVMPYPYIYDGDDNVLNSETQDNGTTETIDDYEIPTSIDGLTVTLTGPDGANFSAFGLNSTSGYYQWIIPTSATDAPAGTYTVTYQYAEANSYSIKKEFTFEIVTDDIDTSLLINGYSDNSGSASIPSLMSLYVESSFPTPVVVNTEASNAEVSVFTEVTLTCKPTDTDNYGSSITYDISNTPSLRDLKFTPTVAGKYTITYKVTDFFGNTQTFRGDIDGITASKTSASGSGYIVTAYDGTNETTLADMKTSAENDTLATVEYSIPSIVAKNSSWVIPALFGIDEEYSYSELSFERDVTYTVEGNTSTTTNVYSSTAPGVYNVKPYESIDYTFSNKGSYKFTFKVKDADGNTLLSQSYTVQVEDDYVDTTNPNVTLNGLSNMVYAGNKIVFTVSDSDYRTDDADTVADSRLQLVVQYKYGTDAWTTLTAEDGKYTIEVPEGTVNDTVLTIQATATDDYGTDRDIGEDIISATTFSTVKTKSITIKNYTGDGDSPTIGGFNITIDWYDVEDSTFKTFVTGDTLTLPIVNITDNNSNLFVSATVKCNGTTISDGVFSAYSGNAKKVVMGGEQFIANLAGTYVVTYQATDVNGNTSYKVFTFEVDGPQVPIITLGTFDTTYEYGTSVDLTNVSVSVNTEEVDYTDNFILMTGTYGTYSEEDIVALINTLVGHAQATDPTDYNADKENYGDILDSIVIQISGGYLADNSNPNSIIAGQSGNVTLKYWAVSDSGEFNTTPQVVTFATEDTTAPVLVINNDGPISTFSAYSSSNTDIQNRVQIPDISSATDLSGVQTPTITAKYNNATKDLTIVKYAQDSEEYADGYYGYFVANDDGYVTVTYSVSDNASPTNTTTQTYSIGIGDISAPQISIAALQASLSDEYNIGDTLTLDLTKLSITDAEALDYTDVDVKVTRDGTDITDDDLSSSDATKMSFLLDEAGTYVITFDVTDSAGNAATQKTITITVAEATSEGTVSTTVWGTILIIAALLVLGVVIYFFVKPSKVKTTGKITAKKEDKKEKDKDDKIVV